MKYRILLLTLLLLQITVGAFSQNVTVISTPIYKAYYSISFRNPLYVVYNLNNGGGDCPREQFRFRADARYNTAKDEDYSHSEYQKGHMVPAEDFAYNCTLDELTFRYYNCKPQTRELNIGPWKTWETRIRKLSHEEPLKIICGGVYGTKSLKNKGVRIPTHCWKIVKSLRTGENIYVLWFTNTTMPEVKQISYGELTQLLPYRINYDAN